MTEKELTEEYLRSFHVHGLPLDVVKQILKMQKLAKERQEQLDIEKLPHIEKFTYDIADLKELPKNKKIVELLIQLPLEKLLQVVIDYYTLIQETVDYDQAKRYTIFVEKIKLILKVLGSKN